MKRVYLDHNATSPLRPEAREALDDALDRIAGNPSSVHAPGRAARAILDDARARVAAALGLLEDEVVFTSGGTESNNLALQGTMAPHGTRGKLVTVSTEHSSVLEVARSLEANGAEVVRCPVDGDGRVERGALLDACHGAQLLSISCANNEVGTVTPLGQLAELLPASSGGARPLLHTDAVQAVGRIHLDLAGWGVDLASISAHKLGGPTGAGILVRRGHAVLSPVFAGGGQEGGLRPGTENVAASAAAAVAIELAVAEQAEFAQRSLELLSELWSDLQRALPGVRILGPDLECAERLPNTLNVHVPGTDGRIIVTRLDLEGLEVSAGSACASGSLEPSHVLLAMGLDEETARAGVRLSLGRTTTQADTRHAVEILSKTFGVCAPRVDRVARR